MKKLGRNFLAASAATLTLIAAPSIAAAEPATPKLHPCPRPLPPRM